MNDITPNSPTRPDDHTDHDDPFAVGRWVWVKDKKWVGGEEKYVPIEWLGCVTHHGSNYVLVRSPASPGRGHSEERVHVNDLWQKLRPEPNADRIIQEKIT